MARILALGGIAAASIIAASSPAHAQRDSVFQPRDSASQQMSIDVSQYDPNVQISEILKTTRMIAQQLTQQNEQMRAELSRIQEKLDHLTKRGDSLGNILTTGTGESIGSMVRKINDKVHED